ncbi:DEBR0S3_07558g1_1 [Brettanomyces bruxellensis]|uniref:DNA repair and recombination protein RAD52 n=1 Tax=Dekkera bruxellensis TaxID=5007 RepID=A0A7D9CYV1_DEKBR|nr:DEBR0S3_07558g1_1 [Brettanomyces bruxellensis]
MDRKFQKSQSMVPFVQYTQDELIRIAEALDKQLGPEFISKRKGPGYNSIQYLEGWKAINLANNIFGPNGWCTELKNFQVDYIDERGGSISMGLSAIVRVSLKDGTFHEDIGYGSIDNCRTKSAAFDKCKKEAVTDGMKRALRQFGNALGNCLYDKDFLSKITKVKQPPKNFDEENLMRVSVKKEKPDLNIASTNKLGASKDTATIKSSAITKRVGPTRSSQAASDDSFMFSDDWPEELSQKDDFAEKPIPDSEPEHDISNDNVDNNKTLDQVPWKITLQSLLYQQM